jgi:ankyrin repeat protein
VKQKDIDVSSQDDNGRTAVSHAAEFGHISIIEILHRSDKRQLEKPDKLAYTPLVWAACGNRVETMKLLIDKYGCYVECKSLQGTTTLIAEVARSGYTEAAKYLLTTFTDKHDPLEVDEDGKTALFHAINYGYLHVFKLLATHSLSRPDSAQSHPSDARRYLYGQALLAIMWPSEDDEKDSEEMAKMLLPHANVNYADHKGRTPLIVAVQMAAENMMRLLLDDPHVDVRMVDWRNRNAWVYAKESQHRRREAIMEMLREKGCTDPLPTEIFKPRARGGGSEEEESDDDDDDSELEEEVSDSEYE